MCHMFFVVSDIDVVVVVRACVGCEVCGVGRSCLDACMSHFVDCTCVRACVWVGGQWTVIEDTIALV